MNPNPSMDAQQSLHTLMELETPGIDPNVDGLWTANNLQFWPDGGGQNTTQGCSTYNVAATSGIQYQKPSRNPFNSHDFGNGLLQSYDMAGPATGASFDSSVQIQPIFWPPSVGPAQSLRLPRQGFTPEQDSLLISLRREGREYSQIAEEMRIRFGIETSENRLVKRFQLIQDKYLDPLPVAIKNAMPDIMVCIKEHMNRIPELAQLAGNEQEFLEQIMQELPRSIPKFVQNKVTSKRKTMLQTSPNRAQ